MLRNFVNRVVKYALLICVLAVVGVVLYSKPVFAGDSKKISLNSTKLTIYTGDNYKLELENAAPGKKITFKSSKKSVAKVDSTGMITAVKAGKAKITAKYNGKNYKCTVTVKKPSAKAKGIYSDSTFAEDEEYAYYLDTEAYASQGTAFGYMSGGHLCKVKKDGSEKPVVLMNDVCYKPMLVGDYIYYLYCWTTKYYDNKFYWCCRIKTDGTGAETLTGKEYSVTDYTVYDNTLYCSVKSADYMIDGKWPDFPTGIYAMNLTDGKMTFVSDAAAYNLTVFNGRLYYAMNYVPSDFKSFSDIGYYLFGINRDGTGKVVYGHMPTNSSDYRQQFVGAGSYIFYVDIDNRLCRIDIAGAGKPENLTEVYGSLAVNGNYLYAAACDKDAYGAVKSKGLIRVNIMSGEVEELLEGEYYPDHIYNNRIYVNSNRSFAAGKLAVFGYNGSEWKIFKDEIDFAALNKLKDVSNLPK